MAVFKNVVSSITPPVVSRGLNAFRRFVQPETKDEPSGVRGADWYNQAYENVADYRLHYTESRYYFVWSVIADRMMRAGAEKIIDLGCGSGQFALLLHDKNFPNYVGIDFSSKSIEMARTRCPFFKFDVADLSKSDVLKRTEYDCVVSMEFLEHVEFDLELIAKIKPGTRFFGTVPNFPYTSHVRHFVNEAEVSSRYEKFFRDYSVDRFLENLQGRTYFVMEGIKR